MNGTEARGVVVDGSDGISHFATYSFESCQQASLYVICVCGKKQRSLSWPGRDGIASHRLTMINVFWTAKTSLAVSVALLQHCYWREQVRTCVDTYTYTSGCGSISCLVLRRRAPEETVEP